MAWTVVLFGKYAGKTLPQIVLTDPDWFFWAVEKDVFTSAALKAEAKDIRRKAMRIKIPPSQPANSMVEYVIHPGVGKLADVKVVPATQPAHQGSSPTHRANHFDLSIPRNIASYDKTGGKVVIGAIKHYVFGKKNTRLTRQRCEQFFDDPSNFA